MTMLYTRPALWRLRLLWLVTGLIFGALIAVGFILFMMVNHWAIILIPDIGIWRNLA